MKKSKNEKVQQFLEELSLMDHAKFKILTEIREIVLDTYPKVEEKIMYGGILFFLDSNMFSGIFSNKNHITIEFGEGFLMKDPNKLLEGKGKYRRHLKIKDQHDILNKQLSFFVKQAI